MQSPDVNKTERKAVEDIGFKNFLARPDETGITWIKRKQDGSCSFLTSNNKCAIYDARPAICRLEPFTIVDYDCENNKIELELNFPFSSCCIGICEAEMLPAKEIAKAAQTMIQKILALTAKDMKLPINEKRVHSETRSRLLRRTIETSDLQL